VDTEPAWSPNGQGVLYTHAAQSSTEAALGALQIWRLDLATGDREYLTAGQSATCSPDGGHIALIDGYRLVVMDLATKTKRTIGPNAPSFRPAWSPDGRWIAYDTNYGDLAGSNAIYLIRPDGTELEDISEHGSGQWNTARWSPDSQWLVHRRYVAGEPELFVMDTTGAQPLRLTNDQADDRDPAWSPDGQWIVWGFFPSQSDEAGLWLMRPDGSDRRLLIAGGFDPSWAPDGTRIAFSYTASPDTAATIWSIEPDGSNLTRLILPDE
jgi:Tol biopolymer transport system component